MSALRDDCAGRFAGELALVIGGSNGIGRAVAEQLARDGADVVVTWFRDREAAAATVAAIQERGRRARAIRLSASGRDLPDRLAEAFDAFGSPRLVVGAAAVGGLGALVGTTSASLGSVYTANVAPFLGAVSEARRAGTLRAAVAVSSSGAADVLPGYGALGAAKAALESVVRYLAAETAPLARVNAVRPGFGDSRSFRRMASEPEATLERLAAEVPLGRLPTSHEVASVITFLLSSDAAMVTGQTLVVDGGMALSGSFAAAAVDAATVGVPA